MMVKVNAFRIKHFQYTLSFMALVIFQVYLCEKLSLVNEMYFSIILDRTTAGPVSTIVLTALTSFP